MTNKEHPHAEVLRAIADGVPLSEFEASFVQGAWCPLNLAAFTNKNDCCGWVESPDRWEIRRKPQYIMVNSFKVPKPLGVLSIGDSYFLADVTDELLYAECKSRDDESDKSWLCRGIAHSTQEAAIAHAKAMLGIDPEYFK